MPWIWWTDCSNFIFTTSKHYVLPCHEIEQKHVFVVVAEPTPSYMKEREANLISFLNGTTIFCCGLVAQHLRLNECNIWLLNHYIDDVGLVTFPQVQLHPPSSTITSIVHQRMICLLFLHKVDILGGGNLGKWGGRYDLPTSLHCGCFILKNQIFNTLCYVWLL